MAHLEPLRTFTTTLSNRSDRHDQVKDEVGEIRLAGGSWESDLNRSKDRGMEPSLLSLPPSSQPIPSSMWIILLLVCATSAAALPTGTGSSTPVRSGGLAIALCTPFLVLAAVKYVYLRHRRAQSIHESGKPSPLLGLGLSISNSTSRLFSPSTRTNVQGYLVGMLGSPDWETRIQARVDREQRRISKESYV